ncbi:membrane protein [Desulfosarcina ovata subsp. sediminis]|uniref:Membrane protein n=1 Tax=Desulfosarcina ovata subsp. sediminis TaxID=885957 RepID=A0A5K7ZX58_9BACT|nr:DMT family transporter [Desulfosarcina ovata]BBO84808.1 membrane protein [Desulfosarcina ovata subsp. sediminis]
MDRATAKGVFLILLATLCIVLMNTCARVSSIHHGPVEMVFYRGVVALSLLVPYMLATHPVSVFKTRRVGAHLYRSIIGNIGVGLVFWAYTLLPMANATALLFSAPLFVTALSPLLLREHVDGQRWMAVALGFGGILLIARPSMGLVTDPASMVGLGAALCIALVDMALRNLGRTEHPLTTVFYFILGGVIFSAPYTFTVGSLPQGHLILWIAGIGLFTVVQQLGKTAAYRFAEASFLAPYSYTAILWATLIGWLLWREWVSVRVVAGSAVVIASNLFILKRAR